MVGALSRLMNLCVSNACEFYAISGLSLTPHKTIPLVVKWHTHDLGWAKLNTDGSSLGNLGPVGWGVGGGYWQS